jgi:hypothetical protein
MKSILLAVALVMGLSNSTWCQEFSAIQSKDGILFQTIQSFQLKDSLLVFFSSSGKKNFNSVIVLPDGTQRILELNELKEKAIATITSSPEQLDFYYFDTTKESVTLNLLGLNRKDREKTILNPISIPGRIIGYEANDSLTVVTYDQKTSLIHVQRFKNFKRTFANQYSVNPQLLKEKVTFISRSDMTQPSDADADIKMYLREKYLWIIAENHANRSMGTSTIFRIEISSGETSTMGIFETSGEKWNTMLCGENILKVVKSKGIKLLAYDFQKNDPVFASEYKESSAMSTERAYERRGVTNEVFPIDIQQSLKAWGRPFVISYGDNSNFMLLKIGTYEPKLNPKSPVPVLGSGVMKLIFEISRIGSYAFNDKVSDDRYFYLKGNFIEGFILDPNPVLLEKTIDDFEIANREKPMFISAKGYIKSRSAAFAFYKYEKHYDQIKIFKFQKP